MVRRKPKSVPVLPRWDWMPREWIPRQRIFSGGEKARLLLGLIAFDGPHLLILDEPTNHLDIESRDALMMALNNFPGAVIVISHDRHLVESTADRLWLVKDGNVRPYEGDIDDYRAEVLTGKNDSNKETETKTVPTQRNSAEKRKLAAEKRKVLAPLQRKIKEAEAVMAKLQKAIGQIDSKLASPDLYANDPSESQQLAIKRAAAEKKLVEIEEVWLEMSEEYESAASGG